jgi:hypothetical protein
MLIEELSKYLSYNIDPQLRKLWVGIYNDMIVHTRGEKPKHLLEINRPNEPKDIIEYRLNTYFPITKDPILKAINSTYHLIKQSDYKLICGNKTKEYLAVKRFESSISINKLDIYTLIFNSFLQIDIEDPNGLLFVEPVNTYDKNDIPQNLPQTEEVDIEIRYIQSKHIKYIDSYILIYETDRIHLGSNKVEAPVYKIVNDTDIFIYYPVKINEQNEIVYELQNYYRHNFGFVPYRVLGGLETLRNIESHSKNYIDKERTNEYKLFDTFFTAYNSWANKAIISSSETDAVKLRYSFPITERLGTECKTCKGHKTILANDCRLGTCGHDRGDCIQTACGTCHGTGHVIAFSPYTEIVKQPPRIVDGETYQDIDTIKYYSPPMESIAINKEYWYEMMDKAEQSISVYQSYDNQSGVAKEYDREQKRDFISVIGDNQFDLLEFAVRCISKYLFDDAIVKVIKPIRYEIRNKEAIINEISNVAKINSNLSKPLALEYIELEYDGEDKRIMEIIIENDIYYSYSLQDLSTLKAMQQFDEKAFNFHMNGFKWLTEIFEDEANLDKTNKEIMELIDEKNIPTSTNGI